MAIHPVFTRALHQAHPEALIQQHGTTLRASTGQQYFAKIGDPSEQDQYTGEAESLKAMGVAAPGIVPAMICSGLIDTDCKWRESDVGRPYFLSEYKDISSLTTDAASELGKRLATEMHTYRSSNGKFGFHLPTFCGPTRQDNGWYDKWSECFDALIGGLVDKLEAKGGFSSLCRQAAQVRERCMRVIPALLNPLDILPVLLHGDLWSGNMGVDRLTGKPVIFDPSCYYGHSEADLAIGRMFGGIPQSFYKTYHDHLPKSSPQDQYELRQELYQLYHYLNHTILFGGSYANSAGRKMERLLREISSVMS